MRACVEYRSLEWSEVFFLRSLRLLFSGRKNCVLKRRAEKGEETGEGGARVGQVTWDGGRLVVQEITMVKDPRRQMGPGDQPALQVKKKRTSMRTVMRTQASCILLTASA